MPGKEGLEGGDHGVVTAVPVAGLEQTVKEIGVERQEGVLHFFIELGDCQGQGQENRLQREVLVETGQVKITVPRYSSNRWVMA